MLPLRFIGGSERDYLALPREAQKAGGFQLKRIQEGKEPFDWKPMPSVGKGVREIRIWERAGTYRVIYYVQSSVGVFVLHAFVKKTQATAKRDIDLARMRLQEVP